MISEHDESLRHWEQTKLDVSFFKTTTSLFKESYFQTDYTSDTDFIAFYDKRGQLLKCSRTEFHSTVLSFQQQLNPSIQIVYAQVGNNIQTLALATAVLLSGIKLCPLNPELSEQSFEKIKSKIGLPGLRFFKNQWFTVEVEALKPRAPTDFIYIPTSGTTGESKIVRQLEASILANVDSLIQWHKMKPESTVLTSLPVFHVNALEFAFFGCLFSGAKLVLLEDSNPALILKAALEQSPKIISLAPSIVRSFINWCKHRDQHKLNGLEYIVTAAAPLSHEIYKETLSQLEVPVLQGFGLSEAVNFSTLMPVDLSLEERNHWMLDFKRPSIGTPIPGNDVFIVDENLQPKEPGELGELAIQGYNVCAGYLDEKNSSTFLKEFLLTGDLGFYELASDGRKFFFIENRKKEIIKRHGTTISLLEVDFELANILREEEEAIAVGFESAFVSEDLAIVFSNPMSLDRMNEIKSLFVQKYPMYLWPSLYIRSMAKVRGPSGKAARGRFKNVLKNYDQEIRPRGGSVETEIIQAE